MDTILKESTYKLSEALLAIAKETRPQSQLEPFEHFSNRFHAQMEEEIEKFQKNFRDGYEALIRGLSNQKGVNYKEFIISEEKLTAIRSKDKIQKMAENNTPFQEVLGFSNEQMITLYGVAANFFENKDYIACMQAYTYLTTLNPYISSYWLGLGSAYEALLQIPEAMMCYKLGVITNCTNLDPYVYAGKCCLASKQYSEAILIFESGINLTKEHPEHEGLQKIAPELQNMLAYIKQREKEGG